MRDLVSSLPDAGDWRDIAWVGYTRPAGRINELSRSQRLVMDVTSQVEQHIGRPTAS